MNACLKDILPQNTFYRHRRILLGFKVDIAVPPIDVESSNVIPMWRVIEAIPVGTPQWAYEQNLVAGWS